MISNTSQDPSSLEPQYKKSTRGRSPINLTIVLSNFFAKNNNTQPRKEFLRCSIFRLLFRTIKSIYKDKAKVIIHPIFIEFCSLVQNNKNFIEEKIDKKNLPSTENKIKKEFKTYNSQFFRCYLNSLLFNKVLFTFLDLVFLVYDTEDIKKKIGIYCCKENCRNKEECKAKYLFLNNAIQQDLLSSIDPQFRTV